MATRKKTSRRKAGSARPMPGWLILLSGILVGLLLAIAAYVAGWVPRPPGHSAPGKSPPVSERPVIEDHSDELQARRKKKYDFYTVLPEMEVVIDKDEIEPVNPREPASYVLQVGSFKNRRDAESLKAQLALLGQQARIQTLEVNQTRWHRVRLGPFDSARRADSIKRRLQKNGINALMMKEK
jgi:cell division protein FtsN